MDANKNNKQIYALVGKNISYSFSKQYFSEKFTKEGLLDKEYINFDIPSLDILPSLIKKHQNLLGMNVTIPYKETIISLLDELDPTAKEIGAVNTIQIQPNGKLKGYNTDYIGFWQSIAPILQPHHTKALLLGTGGASKAIAFAFKNAGIDIQFVSRKKNKNTLSYKELSADIFSEYTIVVNCTPLGTFPNITEVPPISFEHISEKHLLYDLIYNPSETVFLKQGKQHKATTCNGEKMLLLQAEAAWKIWNSTTL